MEKQTCEHCSAEHPIEAMSLMEGCWFCEACTADFQRTFNACDHKWAPHTDEMGDAGHVCERCTGFVANDSFDALFGKGALAALGE